MSKRKRSSKGSPQAARSAGSRPDSRKRKDRQQAPKAPPAKSYVPSPAAIRETIESVVIAFVLAFLFRTFEAEAFVIPTGSMAPTLMGRHKDLECPVCGYPYQVSASDEIDQNTNDLPRDPITGKVIERWVEESTCPMCRYTMRLGSGAAVLEKHPSFKGDRILVGKFCYQFADPKRWDVAVFKFPGGAQTNFIKRLVGLPDEVLEISHGDVFTCPRPKNDESLSKSDLLKLPKTIARKPPDKLLAMLQPVFDNDVMPKIHEYGWPARWRPWPNAAGGQAGGWRTSEDYRSLATDGSGSVETWLRYEHRVPSIDEWSKHDDLARQGLRPKIDPSPQWISDFCAYNTSRGSYDRGSQPSTRGLHWVGDLALMCTLEVRSDSGQALFELAEGGYRMQCRIDVASGMATLTIAPEDPRRRAAKTLDARPYELSGQTDVRGQGKYEIIFSNVDDQLRLWVDGRVVRFGASDEATCYLPLENTRPQAGDFAPVGIGSRGAALQVSHLKIKRDIYYIADGDRAADLSRGVITDYEDFYSGRFGSGPSEAFDHMKQVVFVLKADQFLALGDNSAKSKDSRLWGLEGFEHYVSRRLLIGKALYIYWPHSWDKLPGTRIPFPFFPNIPRMRLVR